MLFDVTVNDADMAMAHRYQIEASDYGTAALMGALRAVADDEIGAVPRGNDRAVAQLIAHELTHVIPVDKLRVH